MKNRTEIQEAISIANKIDKIVEDGFNHVPLYKETPRVFGYECKKCKEKVGSIERLVHLVENHNLPYFSDGRAALIWVISEMQSKEN